MFKTATAAILLITFISCGENQEVDRKDGFSDVAKTPEDSLFQAVMDGHDAAMAKMGKLSGYQKQLDQKIDSVKKIKSANQKKLELEYTEIKARLKSAENSMNTWMEEFQIDSAQDNSVERLKYLSDEKLRVEKVREQIFSALDQADSLFERK